MMAAKLKSTGHRVWIDSRSEGGRYHVFFPYGFRAKSGLLGEWREINEGKLVFEKPKKDNALKLAS